jgi:hypothetical protein
MAGAWPDRNRFGARRFTLPESLQGDRLMSTSEPAASATAETQSSLQDGYSRFDETAHRLAERAGEATDQSAADEAEGYVHQGLHNISRAGSAVAGAIRQKPFVSLALAALGGALMAVSRRG